MFRKKNAIAEVKPQGQLEWYSEVPRSIRLHSSIGLAVLLASSVSYTHLTLPTKRIV